MSKQITIYTTQSCPHCRRAKAFLKSKNIPFKEVDLTHDQAKRDELQEKTGWMTVPMIFVSEAVPGAGGGGEELIGGADDLFKLEESGQLDAKLK